jgi:hypothetical protein
MGIKKERRFCLAEQRPVLAEKQTPNHILHLLMSILTMGVWLIVWFAVSAFAKPYLCPNCGSRTRHLKWRER